MEENSEILLKYQKLALEYSKLKAQTSVLKAAVGDEQASALETQETLKKKEQLIRKLEQEIECLNFRNLQLTKRVSILQNDLQLADANMKHSKGKPHSNNQASQDSYNILNVELQSRIEENEKLHQQVYTAEIEHKKAVSELSSTVEQLKLDLADQERKLNEKIQEQGTTINSLIKEKVKMQITLKNYEKEVKDRKLKEETKERDTTLAKENLKFQLEDAKTVVSEKIYFNDTRLDYLNCFNVPVILRREQEKLSVLMLQLHTYVSEITHQLLDLHTYMEQKIRFNQDDEIKVVSQKLQSFLPENVEYLKNLLSSFGNISSAIKEDTSAWVDKSCIREISTILTKYVWYLDKMLPYLILSIEFEDTRKGSVQKIKDANQKLLLLFRQLTNAFKKLERYILLLVDIGSSKDIYFVDQPTIVRKILSTLEFLQSSFEELRKAFGSKMVADHQLPITNASEKSTDECILSTLVSLSSSLKKLVTLMNENIDVLARNIPYKPRNLAKKIALHPCVWSNKERGANYMQQIKEADVSSIPYEVARKNFHTLKNYADNQESLTQQLEQCRNKLLHLELDKENWMLECQLMKAKEIRNSQSPTENESKSGEYDEIQLFVKSTVNQLIKQIQLADSKIIAYRNECEMLHQKLKMSYQKDIKLENENEIAKQMIEDMKEEQKMLKTSYEDQLNLMSEHLANLNETLTIQKDEIDELRQMANTKSSKKGKSK